MSNLENHKVREEKQYEADMSVYKTISILGQCFEGKAVVHLAKHLPSGRMLAFKKFHMDKIQKDMIELVEQEIILTKQLQHRNILPYLVSFVNGLEVCVVSPLMAYGSCRDLLNSHFNEGFQEVAIVFILRDVLEALDYVHKKGIIHRSIRASHVLISEYGLVCLSGFRYACPIVSDGKWQQCIHSFPESTVRNLNWLSPEMLEQNMQGYNEKSDIYSVGMLICELANGAEPFAGVSTTLMLTEKVRGCVPQLLDCTTVVRGENNENNDQGDYEISANICNRRYSENLHEVAALCLQREAYARPATYKLLTHPLFKYCKKDYYLPELLKPAIPMGERVACHNTDEMADLDTIQRFSEMELPSYEWEF